MHPRALAPLALLALAFLACGGAEEESSTPRETPADWASAWAELAAEGPGFVVWESNRSGRWRIWHRRLDGSDLRRLGPDPEDRDHFAPHVSPDGRHLVYVSIKAGSTLYSKPRREAMTQLHLLDLEDGSDRVLAEGVQSYGEDRAAVWIDTRRLMYIAADATTRELNLATGSERVLLLGAGKHGVLLDPTLRHATSNRVTFSPYDPERRVLAPLRHHGGCQPYFTRDGRFGYWVARPGGPIRRVDLDTRQEADMVARYDPRLPKGFFHAYFPMVSPGQDLLAFAASRGEHDHFRADYEVLVAPIDPQTLGLLGRPVRYSFHPGTDRYPDVYRSGSELGRHRGEAPFPVTLDPGGESGDPWQWSFGDGTRMEGAVGRHIYTRAGEYRVTAARGSVLRSGQVSVEPAAPPRAIRVRVTHDHREVRITFDEPIDLEEPQIRFEQSGLPASVEIAGDGRTLRVQPAQPIDAADVLRVAGIVDTALEPNRIAEGIFLVEPHDWPSRRDGLLVLWQTANHRNLIRDPETGAERAYEPVLWGRARYDNAWRMAPAGGSFEMRDQAQIVERMAKAEAFSMEATVVVRSLDHDGEGVILAMGKNERPPNLGLLQEGDRLVLGIRTPEGFGDRVELGRLPSEGPHHVLIAYRPGRLVAYLDGKPLFERDDVRIDFRAWAGRPRISVGALLGRGMPWAGGAVEGIAFYDRFIEADEAARNAQAYAERREERNVVEPVRLKARLRATSRSPELRAIAPYREALVVYEYEVLRVLDGEYGEDVIRVAHYAILQGRVQDISRARPGTKTELLLEPLDDNPQVESLFRADDLELDLEAPLYLDVGL